MASAPPARCLLDLITQVDNVPLSFEQNFAPYYRLFLAPDPRPHGYIHPTVVTSMPWPSSFAINHDTRSVTLSPPPAELSLRPHASSAFQDAVDRALEADIFPILHGEHSEYFRIIGARDYVRVERFASPLFGIANRGAHLTGYVRSPDGEIKIWVARRSRHLFTYPGQLDSTVAGGVKANDAPLDCVLAESIEEASLPLAFVAANIRAAGVITIANRNPSSGLFHADVLYVYDLDLGALAPTPGDDEVEGFELMATAEVTERMRRGEFKPNVCPVLIDFLIRHGVVTPEGEADYVEICQRLRRKIPVPTSPSDESVRGTG